MRVGFQYTKRSWIRRALISILTLAALALLFAAAPPTFASGPVDEEGKESPVWSADMLVVEYTDVSIGAASADLFSNVGGSAGLQVKSLWSYTPDRDLRLAFEEAVPGAADLTLQVGDLRLAFPAGSSGQSSFRWNDVDVDWEDGQTLAVRIVPTSATAAPQPNSPATGAPTISGTAQVGETLTAETSAIADEDGLDNASFSYQWLADDADIQGETASTYTLVTDDVGKAIKVRVTFDDSKGNEETLTSTATAAVAAEANSPATGAPTISGTAQVGETLMAHTTGIADEDGLDNAVFGYQWLADDADIQGETASTYTLVTDDIDKTIQVRVSFDDSKGNEETLTSQPTEAVAAKPNSPATGAPTIIGTAQVGETLTAHTTGISDEDGLDNAVFGYQWLADNSDIQGETAATYTLVNDDVGKAIKLKVSFTDDAGNEETLTSVATVKVVPLGTCLESDSNPTPTVVMVRAIPIVVESTSEEYFVLYVRQELDADSSLDLPVLVQRGETGRTTLGENIVALPKERYRVEKYSIAKPADVDGDCIDDMTELADPVGMNPVNPAASIDFSDGAISVPDLETFEALSFEVPVSDVFPTGPLYLKFIMYDMETDNPGVFFIKDSARVHHRDFLESVGIEWDRAIRDVIAYHQDLVAPDGSRGVYSYWLQTYNFLHSFSVQERCYRLLAASMPLLDDNLALYLRNDGLPYSQTNLPLYEDSGINLVFEEDIYAEIDFQALNPGEGYGLLRVREPAERPHPHEIVVYEALPNELPRVAGIITTIPQTPLSHVNLRAVQDGVPNAFIRSALDKTEIADLIGSYVHYTVTEDEWTLRATNPEEVAAHFAAARPSQTQTPERDLTVTEITGLSNIGFNDWNAFGVKAANVAVLRTLGFPDGTVPDGFAVPFYFYDEFMKHNDFYDYINEMLADTDFQTDFDTQESELKKLRKKIKKGETPAWMTEALEEMHSAFPKGTSLRYRSSTNNEDLPGFNGAGLYDSKTQHPDETEEDGIAKSLKQVYASLWNFRAFTDREFHRIDHLAAAMGVLVHPNYSDELANGVAVSFDPLYGKNRVYYVNTQLGEDLVTNPDAHSAPEEVLLNPSGSGTVLTTSNQVPPGQVLLSGDQLYALRQRLEVIHEEFAELYDTEPNERFAMEIEFKITSENTLSIKQARPWVFEDEAASGLNFPATGEPTISGTAQVGQTLIANTSGIADADGLDNVSYSYQWLADYTAIANATRSTYTLADADEDKAIKVKVAFTDDAGNDETLISAPTAGVEAASGPLTGFSLLDASNQTKPLANLEEGHEVSLADPAGGSYAIRADIKPGSTVGSVKLELKGTKAATRMENHSPYSLFGDYGENALNGQDMPVGSYTLKATAYSEGGGSGDVLGVLEISFAVATSNTPATGLPAITGTAQVGQTLIASTSGIADADGLDKVSYSYRWLADDANIQGETASTYTLVTEDVGKAIKVKVTFTDGRGNEEMLTSAATAAVAYVDGPPSAPREVKVKAGDTELLVSWLPPAEENKAPVERYRILYTKEGGSDQELHTTQLSQVIGNLTGGVPYRVQVTAKNAAGYGTPSDEMSETPDMMPPWRADMLVVAYTDVSIGAASADLFSNVDGTADLQVKSLWYYTPDRELRLAFQESYFQYRGLDAASWRSQAGISGGEFREQRL